MTPIAGSGRDTIMKKHIDISIAEVSEAYAGAVGTLWEMVMGEEIHIGGTDGYPGTGSSGRDNKR